MKIFILRHAETVMNQKKLFQGTIDCELSPEGTIKTKEKAKTFPQIFDVCFCSPLKRAKQTAEILVPNLPIIYDQRIVEGNLGSWENTPITDEKRNLLHQGFIPEDGETQEAINRRILDFLRMIQTDYKNQTVLISAHNGIISSIQRLLHGNHKKVDNLELVEFELEDII